ncbi:MAG: hypothetical protein IJ828_07285 [Treponema sp.]|nr:hypothetical protein [Treponema sp.]
MMTEKNESVNKKLKERIEECPEKAKNCPFVFSPQFFMNQRKNHLPIFVDFKEHR